MSFTQHGDLPNVISVDEESCDNVISYLADLHTIDWKEHHQAHECKYESFGRDALPSIPSLADKRFLPTLTFSFTSNNITTMKIEISCPCGYSRDITKNEFHPDYD